MCFHHPPAAFLVQWARVREELGGDVQVEVLGNELIGTEATPGASKNDYIVLNGTVRFKIICMFLGGLVSRTLFLVGMQPTQPFLGVFGFCEEKLRS